MARRCGNCVHKNVCELYDIVQDPTHAVGCGNFLDTADVVPKSEVDQWYNEYHSIKDELKREKMEHNATEKLADRYCVELQTAKSEVAREFAEEVKLEFYREFDEIIPSIMADKIDDLVKKYTEEK